MPVRAKSFVGNGHGHSVFIYFQNMYRYGAKQNKFNALKIIGRIHRHVF